MGQHCASRKSKRTFSNSTQTSQQLHALALGREQLYSKRHGRGQSRLAIRHQENIPMWWKRRSPISKHSNKGLSWPEAFWLLRESLCVADYPRPGLLRGRIWITHKLPTCLGAPKPKDPWLPPPPQKERALFPQRCLPTVGWEQGTELKSQATSCRVAPRFLLCDALQQVTVVCILNITILA